MKSITRSYSYQPGLDGVRAVAVVAVLVYHLGASWLPGGFLGVDVFFALSGFLITTLLLTRAGADGRVDLVDFLTRRARRLLPAALVMVAVVAVVGAFTMTPDRLGPLRLDGVWTVLQAANWRFVVSGQSYVDAFAPPSPLRHAWSLAVEEQFYLVWPIVVAGFVRRRRALLATALVVACASAAWMGYSYAPDPSRAYYGTDTRVHALLAGAGLAIVLLGPGRDRWVRLLGWLALPAPVVLAVAFAVVSDEAPGYYRGAGFGLALVATVLVGAVAVAPDGLVGRLFRVAPLPWLGRRSYSLYLWHWPVFCWLEPLPGAGGVAAKLALTAVLALASYHLIELPVRRNRFARPGAFLVASGAVASALAVVVVATTGAAPPLVGEPAEPGAKPQLLAAASSPSAIRLATAGDSVARSLAPGLRQVADAQGWGYADSAVSSCSVAGLLMVEPDGSTYRAGRRCPEVVPPMQRELVANFDPTLILVHSRWENQPVRRPDGVVVRPGSAAHLAYVRSRLVVALGRLTAGRAHVVLIEPIPAADSLCRRLGNSPETCRDQLRDPGAEQYNALRRSMATAFPGRVTVISVADLVCPGGVCTDEVGGRRPRPDGLHFSPSGAAWIAPLILHRAVDAGALG
ncbi:acyltransferase family protein [Cryptosporangium arvum]|uniref:acyltransferase family protein n=1 Tax=Cryptosporangium arvum TaxID=80871 RepID=UPI0004B6F5EB|nr:acyltransferase family protein [Cryptosporangium arvum]